MVATTPRSRLDPLGGLTAWLVAVAVGVYVLVVVGATTAILDGAAGCATWPACEGSWVVSLAEPAAFAAWLHRLGALLVGVGLFATAVRAHRCGARRRIQVGLGVALALYPLQIVLGALTVAGEPSLALSMAHLLVGMGIFSGVLLALLWRLETETGTADPASLRRDSPPDSPTDTPADPPASVESLTPGERVRAYVRLTKPKLWWLLCLVAVAGMVMAGGRTLDAGTVAATLLGGVLAVGASGTFNNVYERDVDRHMGRTEDRPLVTGEIPPRRAVVFGFGLAVASTAVFLAFVNPLAAALGLLAILFYSVVYTMILKPNTDQNIVIGGAVGAFPALIGWAAVENTVGLHAIVLGTVIFLWTPAHFYNLALAYREDYDRAGFPMLPVVRGETTTLRHVLLYLGATMLGVVLLGTATRLGVVFAGTVTVAGCVFLWFVVRHFRERTEAAAFRAFHASNAYLGATLLAVVVDAIAV